MEKKRMLIYTLFTTSLVIANVVTGKILQIGPFTVPGAVLLYGITFLCTDLVSELYGKKEAQKLVLTGFVCSLFASVMILLTQYLPSAVFAMDKQEAYVTLLGMNFKFVFASMVAYSVSQSWDVWMFHKMGKLTGGKHKWIRNNVSTMTSQLFDTVIFITIAFAGVVPNLLWMIVSQYIVKLIIALMDTPIFYLFTKNVTQKEFIKGTK